MTNNKSKLLIMLRKTQEHSEYAYQWGNNDEAEVEAAKACEMLDHAIALAECEAASSFLDPIEEYKALFARMDALWLAMTLEERNTAIDITLRSHDSKSVDKEVLVETTTNTF